MRPGFWSQQTETASAIRTMGGLRCTGSSPKPQATCMHDSMLMVLAGRWITHPAWVRHNQGTTGGGGRRRNGTSTEHPRNIDGTSTEQKSNANGQMGLYMCIEGEGQAGQEPAGAPGGVGNRAGGVGRARPRAYLAPGHSRTQAGPRAKHTACINCKTRDLNDRPFRCQSKTLSTRPQTVTWSLPGCLNLFEEHLPIFIQCIAMR